MADHPLTYLLDRFATDATTLRARATHLAGKPAPPHGPDAAASTRMAEACDDVLRRLQAHAGPGVADDVLLDGLETLGPALEALAARASDAFVRSVYGGAAARVEEIVRRTRSAAIADDDDADDDDLDDDDADDDELADD